MRLLLGSGLCQYLPCLWILLQEVVRSEDVSGQLSGRAARPRDSYLPTV